MDNKFSNFMSQIALPELGGGVGDFITFAFLSLPVHLS